MNSRELIIEIVNDIDLISKLTFFKFSFPKILQERMILTEQESHLITRALDRKKECGSRFWDALLFLSSEYDSCTDKIINEALFHQKNRNLVCVDRSELEIYLDNLKTGDMIAINSQVTLTDGAPMHLPLLDFKLSSNAKNAALATRCIEALELSGFLVDSGQSFHFFGNNLISEYDLLDLLARFSFLHPLADRAWASHQILERSASLRITPKDGIESTLIASI